MLQPIMEATFSPGQPTLLSSKQRAQSWPLSLDQDRDISGTSLRSWMFLHPRNEGRPNITGRRKKRRVIATITKLLRVAKAGASKKLTTLRRNWRNRCIPTCMSRASPPSAALMTRPNSPRPSISSSMKSCNSISIVCPPNSEVSIDEEPRPDPHTSV